MIGDLGRWLVFAARNLLRNRRRSATTVAVAALGTAAILLASGFALFTYEALEQDAARSTGHLVLARQAQFQAEEDMPLQHGIDGAPALARRLLELPAVRQVLPSIEFSGLISNGDKSTVMLGYGVVPQAEFAIKGPFLTVTDGEVLAAGDDRMVLLGKGLAHVLKARAGSGLTLMATTSQGALNAIDVTVKGVVDTGMPDLDLRLVYTDLALAQKLLASERVSRVGVFLDRMEATQPMRPQVGALAPQGVAMKAWDELAPYYQSVRALYNRIFGALGGILGVIVVFVVVNAMAMAVVERTREIGALRAMGSSPGLLTGLFATEGLLLGVVGALLGTLLAVAVALALMVLPFEMPPPPGRSVGYPLQVSLNTQLVAWTVGAIMLITTLASGWVARRALRRPIVEALGHV